MPQLKFLKCALFTNKTIALILGVLAMVFSLALIVRAWTEPSQAPPGGNVPSPVHIGPTSQIKIGSLTTTILTTSEGKLYLDDTTEGDIERVNAIIGFDDLILRGRAGNDRPIYLEGRPLVINNDPGTGNVGIGTASPAWTVETYKDALDVSMVVHSRGYARGGIAALKTGNRSVALFTTTSNDPINIGYSGENESTLGSNFVSRIFINNSSGNVGIGTMDPRARLEIAGQIKITGGSPAANKVLTSDASGLASWQTPAGTGLPSGASGQTLRHDGTNWIANSLLYNNGTGVGINNTNPAKKLTVSGGGSTIYIGERISDVSGCQNYNDEICASPNLWLSAAGTGKVYIADSLSMLGNINMGGYSVEGIAGLFFNQGSSIEEKSGPRRFEIDSGRIDFLGPIRVTTLTNCNTIDTDSAGNLICGVDETGGAGGGAPTDASYVVADLNATLTNERRITAGTGISIDYGVANGNLTITNTGDLSNTNEIQNIIANKGLQRDASYNFGLINCATDQILKYTSAGQWICAVDATGGAGGGGDISGSGTATQVAFFTGTKTIASDSNLYWNNTNKRLGIGTAAPQASLHIEKFASPSDRFLYIYNTNSSIVAATNATAIETGATALGGTTMIVTTGGVIRQYLSGIEVNRINPGGNSFITSGNVGIGVSDSQGARLKVGGDVYIDGHIGIKRTFDSSARLIINAGPVYGVLSESSGTGVGLAGYGSGSGTGIIGFSDSGKAGYFIANTGWAGYFVGKTYMSDKVGIHTIDGVGNIVEPTGLFSVENIFRYGSYSMSQPIPRPIFGDARDDRRLDFGELVFTTNWPGIAFNSYWTDAGTPDTADDVNKYITDDSAFNLYHDQSADALRIGYAPSGTAGTTVNYNTAFSINTSGEVRIEKSLRVPNCYVCMGWSDSDRNKTKPDSNKWSCVPFVSTGSDPNSGWTKALTQSGALANEPGDDNWYLKFYCQ